MFLERSPLEVLFVSLTGHIPLGALQTCRMCLVAFQSFLLACQTSYSNISLVTKVLQICSPFRLLLCFGFVTVPSGTDFEATALVAVFETFLGLTIFFESASGRGPMRDDGPKRVLGDGKLIVSI